MNKICAIIVFTILFFTLKGFGQNHSSPSPSIKSSGKDSKPSVDSAKKAADTDTSDDDDDDDVRSYAIGLEFGTDQNSHGIHSNKKLPYMEPSFTYTAPKGFYISVSDRYIFVKDSGGFDVFALNPGWNIDLTDNTTLNFNATHYWFKSRTPLIIEEDLSDAVETYIDQSIGQTEGRFTIDYNYYKATSVVQTPGDFIFTPDISHEFKIPFTKKTSLSIVPEGNFDFGTTNAYSHYLANAGDTSFVREYKKTKKTGIKPFAVLDYNLILTFDLRIGDFELEPALNYNVPVYKVQGIPTKPIGYGTVNLIYTIK